MKRTSPLVAASLFAVAAVAAAGPAYTYYCVGAGNWTGRTGWAGNAHHTISHTAKVGIAKVTFSEKHNKPVWIRVEGRPLSNQGGTGEGDRKELSDEIGPMGGADLSVPSGSWVRGVQVCSQHERDDEDRQIRGLRFVTAKADAHGKIVDDAKVYEHKAAGCKDWSDAWAKCAPGEVARGVRAYHNGKWYTGLALECGPLEKQ